MKTKNENRTEIAEKQQKQYVSLGRVVATRAVVEQIPAQIYIDSLLTRHAIGDWGNICAEDWKSNDWSLQHGARILSSYESPKGTRFWIITEADRSVTTILLPSDY